MMLAACACSVYGVTNVVHDAARDLVLNTANRNIYTNLYGGVWSYMRSTSYTGARTLLPGIRYSTDTETDASGTNYWPNTEAGDLKIYWERGPAKVGGGGYDLPRFAVNPSPWPDSKTFMRGAAYPVIPPGALSCHPGNPNSENYCAVLRFTVPRVRHRVRLLVRSPDPRPRLRPLHSQRLDHHLPIAARGAPQTFRARPPRPAPQTYSRPKAL
jgi:hypothetical protein